MLNTYNHNSHNNVNTTVENDTVSGIITKTYPKSFFKYCQIGSPLMKELTVERPVLEFDGTAEPVVIIQAMCIGDSYMMVEVMKEKDFNSKTGIVTELKEDEGIEKERGLSADLVERSLQAGAEALEVLAGLRSLREVAIHREWRRRVERLCDVQNPLEKEDSECEVVELRRYEEMMKEEYRKHINNIIGNSQSKEEKLCVV